MHIILFGKINLNLDQLFWMEGKNASYNINGINSLHQGIELDFALKLHENIQYEFLASIGNWKWNSGDTVNLFLNQQLVATDYFDARGCMLGILPKLKLDLV